MYAPCNWVIVLEVNDEETSSKHTAMVLGGNPSPTQRSSRTHCKMCMAQLLAVAIVQCTQAKLHMVRLLVWPLLMHYIPCDGFHIDQQHQEWLQQYLRHCDCLCSQYSPRSLIGAPRNWADQLLNRLWEPWQWSPNIYSELISPILGLRSKILANWEQRQSQWANTAAIILGVVDQYGIHHKVCSAISRGHTSNSDHM